MILKIENKSLPINAPQVPRRLWDCVKHFCTFHSLRMRFRCYSWQVELMISSFSCTRAVYYLYYIWLRPQHTFRSLINRPLFCKPSPWPFRNGWTCAAVVTLTLETVQNHTSSGWYITTGQSEVERHQSWPCHIIWSTEADRIEGKPASGRSAKPLLRLIPCDSLFVQSIDSGFQSLHSPENDDKIILYRGIIGFEGYSWWTWAGLKGQ